MNRHEAIRELMGAWLQRDGEFCASAREEAESLEELRAALRALGVTDAEMDADDDEELG